MNLTASAGAYFLPSLEKGESVKEANQAKEDIHQSKALCRPQRLSLEAICLLSLIGTGKNSLELAQIIEDKGYRRSTAAANTARLIDYGLVSRESGDRSAPFTKSYTYKQTSGGIALLDSVKLILG